MITPSDTPSSPSDYAAVTPHSRGPAPYDIQAPMEDLSAVTAAAGRESGAGIVYPVSGRQSDTQNLICPRRDTRISTFSVATPGVAAKRGPSTSAHPAPDTFDRSRGYRLLPSG